MAFRVHKLSLHYLITFSLMVLLPFFLFGYFINFFYNRFLAGEMEGSMTETVQQLAVNLENEIDGMTILSSSLIHNQEFIEAYSGYADPSDPAESFLYQDRMEDQLSHLFLSTNKIGSIYIYSGDREPFVFRNYPVPSGMSANMEPPLPDEGILEGVRENVIRIEDRFFTLFRDDDPQKEPLLSLFVKPNVDPLSRDNIRIIHFAFRVNLLRELYRQPPEKGYAIISRSGEDILLRNIPEPLAREILGSSASDGGHWITASAIIPSTGWTVTISQERKVLLRPVLRIRLASNIILSVILVFFALYTILFFHNMITPLNHLAEKMELVEGGDYAVRIAAAAGPEELVYVQERFNSMIGQVQRLTEEKERDQKEKSLLELQALQYQINPHFVANTLNSIRMMAVVSGADHIKNMTSSLMRLVNDSFRNEGSETTLAEEKESLASYVHIMKVRTGSPIDLRFSIPPGLENCSLRKMLLQPLVENSIIHGFRQGQAKGTILIQAREEKGALRLRIIDNGEGMEREDGSGLPRPRGKSKGLTSLGLESVGRRIKLNYGDDYGLAMESRKGFYTSVTVILPLLKQEESEL